MLPNDIDDRTRAGVQEVARALLSELPAIGEGVAAHILGAEPGFSRAGTDDLVNGTVQANSNTLLDGLLRNLPAEVVGPPAEVLQNMREFVRRGVTVAMVERGYRVGISWWCARWANAVQEHCQDATLLVPVTSAGTTYLLAWMDHVLERVSAEARDESARIAREGALVHVEEVRRILATDATDLSGASRRLAYELDVHHLGFVLRRLQPEAGAPSLEAVARDLAQAVSNRRPLIVRVDVATAWCWVPVSASRDVVLPPVHHSVVGGHGRVATGVAGFRSSHREAQEALRVALLARDDGGVVTAYDGVSVVSLCTSDLDWARTFVAGQLGELAGVDREMAMLRDTLAAFFSANCGYRESAKRLGLHHNTVRYRLARVERLLGREVGADRLALELAVQMAQRMGTAVTESASG